MRVPRAVLCGLVVAVAVRADAAPAADIVILWVEQPPAPATAAVTEAARRAGAALIDVSPAGQTPPDAGPDARRGIDAYNALEFDAALTALDAAVAEVDRTGGGALDAVALGELFLYRGLVHVQRGDDSRAWDDFVTAAAIEPTRVLDPARFPPRAIDQHARAVAAIAARDRGTIELAPRGCRVTLDGRPVTGDSIELGFGRHWVRGDCEGHEPTGQRIEVDRPHATVTVAGPELRPPTDDELVIQGRSAGARSVVFVSIRGGIALARRIGIDGKEQDRGTVAVTGPSDSPKVGDLVSRLLAPPVVKRSRWYQSRWVWAAAGAAIASAILIPLTVGGGAASSAVIRPDGVPAW